MRASRQEAEEKEEQPEDLGPSTAELLDPVLLLLGPVCQTILETFDPAAPQNQGVLPEDLEALSGCYASVVAAIFLTVSMRGKDELVLHLIMREPANVYRSLEGAVRASCGVSSRELLCVEPPHLDVLIAMNMDLVSSYGRAEHRRLAGC
eukprot:gene7343-7555_t